MKLSERQQRRAPAYCETAFDRVYFVRYFAAPERTGFVTPWKVTAFLENAETEGRAPETHVVECWISGHDSGPYLQHDGREWIAECSRWEDIHDAKTQAVAEAAAEAQQIADKIAAHRNTTDGYTENAQNLADRIKRQPEINSYVICFRDMLTMILDRLETDNYREITEARAKANLRREAEARKTA